MGRTKKFKKSVESIKDQREYKNYTTYQSTYFIDVCLQGVIKNPKNQGNPLSTSKDMHRTSFNVGNNLLLHCIAFKPEATRIYR